MIRSVHDSIPLVEKLQQEKLRFETLWRTFDATPRALLTPLEGQYLGELLVNLEDTAHAIERLLAANRGKKVNDRT